ncbi:ABC transporter permease [Anaerobacillus alkalidiazotrophicus]|uniref:ABC transporter permease n=1 Tax=Anaerobacillus alkalidiazotrophicus TaxID=472963 RepID=A0A1S2MCB2_9BACI|nr:ABC transporter permease [Anaerobacillus alkalidiazotrophicus]OIJ21457.1 ABC transporter permease [Anaerobacillus alkalidiazotrophicus]
MKVKALVIRIIRQFIRDRRTIAMIIVAPMFILWLVSLVFAGEKYEPTVGLVGGDERIAEKFENAVMFNEEKGALTALINTEIDGYLVIQESSPTIVIEGTDPAINNAVIHMVQTAIQSLQNSNVEKQSKPEIVYYYGSENMSTFDNIGPFLIGFFVFFFVFIIAGVSFLRERTSGTLEKLLSTPIKRWEIVIGYVLGFGIFTTIQSAIIVFFSIKILGMTMIGSIWLVLLITLILSMTALTLGTLLSAFAKTELQMFQFIPIVIVPQVFFSGLFNVDTMVPWLKSLSIIMPLTYGGEAMRDIMLRGKGISDIVFNLTILMLCSIGFMILNNLALKKHRKI